MQGIDPLVGTLVSTAGSLWGIVSVGFLAALGVLNFFSFWTRKSDEIREAAFARVRRHAQDGGKQLAQDLTRLRLLRDRPDARVLKDAKGFVLATYTSTQPYGTDEVNDFFFDITVAIHHRAQFPISPKLQCALLLVEHGDEWFSQDEVEAEEVFRAHLNWLLDGLGNRILRLPEAVKLLDEQLAGRTTAGASARSARALAAFLSRLRSEGAVSDHTEFLPLVITYESIDAPQPNGEAAARQPVELHFLANPKRLELGSDAIKGKVKSLFECAGVPVSAVECISTTDPGLQALLKDANGTWLLVDQAVLEEAATADPPLVLPEWLVNQRVVIAYLNALLPQTYRYLGLPPDSPLPAIDVGADAGQPETATHISSALKMAELRLELQPKVILSRRQSRAAEDPEAAGDAYADGDESCHCMPSGLCQGVGTGERPEL